MPEAQTNAKPSVPTPATTLLDLTSSLPTSSPTTSTTTSNSPLPAAAPSCGPPHTKMPLPRSAARLITAPRARLQILPLQQRAGLSTTPVLRAGDHAHEDHYDPPTGWLFGVKPGEKYEPEGWENVWYYGFLGSILFGVVGYCYKPDTRCV